MHYSLYLPYLQVRHPNIVTLDDVFVSFSGNLYLVFELLDRDLKQFLDDGCRWVTAHDGCVL